MRKNIKDFFVEMGEENSFSTGLCEYFKKTIESGWAEAFKNIQLGVLTAALCHWISASASSHKAKVLISEQDRCAINDLTSERFKKILPSSAIIELVDLQEAASNFILMKRSRFESDDLNVFLEDQDSGPICTAILHFDNSSQFFLAQEAILNNLFSQASVMAIVIVSADEILTIDCGADWEIIKNKIYGKNICSFINNKWHLSDKSLYKNAPHKINQGKSTWLIKEVSINEWNKSSFYVKKSAVAGRVERRIAFFSDQGSTEKPLANILPTSEITLARSHGVKLSGTSVIWDNDSYLPQLLSPHDPRHSLSVERESVATFGAALILPTANTHHSHWLLETIQHLHWLPQISSDQELTIIASSLLSESQREYLKWTLGGKYPIYYKLPETTVDVRLLYSFIGVSNSYTGCGFDYLQKLAAGEVFPSQSQEKIYVSRRDSRIYRNLVNEDEVEDLFNSYGYETVVASDLTFLDKVKIFKNAARIAGPLGAAIHYGCFSQMRPVFTFLTAEHYLPGEFFQLSSLIESPSINVFLGTQLAHADAWGGSHSSFYLNPTLLKRCLEENII